MKKLIQFMLISFSIVTLGSTASFADEVHWSYEGTTGPDHWGEFFPTCGIGKTQSPIDIKGPFKSVKNPLEVSYKESNLRILNNGHTIQVNIDPGSTLKVNGMDYDLLQFHFHKPSEEKLNGQAKAMVAHFVHKSKEGKLAVIGVLLDEGNASELIKSIWANLPKETGKELAVAGAKIKPADLLPKNLGYYNYVGSLTTPPCSEGVSFYILKNTMHVSKDQVAAFPYKVNARPVQPLNGREISEMN